MRLIVSDTTARILLTRLRDEQPDSGLDDVQRQLRAGLAPRPGQPLSGDELDVVIEAANAALRRMDGRVLDGMLLRSALPKLRLMRDRQRQREDGDDEK